MNRGHYHGLRHAQTTGCTECNPGCPALPPQTTVSARGFPYLRYQIKRTTSVRLPASLFDLLGLLLIVHALLGAPCSCMAQQAPMSLPGAQAPQAQAVPGRSLPGQSDALSKLLGGGQYCPYCGQQLLTSLTQLCPKCGRLISSTSSSGPFPSRQSGTTTTPVRTHYVPIRVRPYLSPSSTAHAPLGAGSTAGLPKHYGPTPRSGGAKTPTGVWAAILAFFAALSAGLKKLGQKPSESPDNVAKQ